MSCREARARKSKPVQCARAALKPEQYDRGQWFLGKLVKGKPEFRRTPIVIKYPSKEVA